MVAVAVAVQQWKQGTVQLTQHSSSSSSSAVAARSDRQAKMQLGEVPGRNRGECSCVAYLNTQLVVGYLDSRLSLGRLQRIWLTLRQRAFLLPHQVGLSLW